MDSDQNWMQTPEIINAAPGSNYFHIYAGPGGTRNSLELQCECFIQAMEFEFVANQLAHRTATFSEGFHIQLISSHVVNSAFYLELYLKCLLLIDSKVPKHKHDLLVHFDDLQERQPRIEVLYEKWRAEVFREHPGWGLPIRKLLEYCNTAFDDWRYCHESFRNLFYYGDVVIPIVKRVIFEASPALDERLALRFGLACRYPNHKAPK
jgi:hypothetical protein